MLKQLVHWVCYILGIVLVAAPLPEDSSVWVGVVSGGLGGFLIAYGLESIIKDIIREENDGRQ